MSSKTKQQTFDFRAWGGARHGAGRKRSGPRARVPHDKREELERPIPVHVTLRLRDGLPSLRSEHAHRVFRAALAAGAERFGFKLVHYVVLSNHAHLICEARDELALSRGMQGLCVRLAKALNRAWQRRGKVFGDRYHSHPLRTPREVRHALAYVLHNAHHHKLRLGSALDPFSSAAWFDGWRESRTLIGACVTPSPFALPSAWLLRIGWRKWGLLARDPAAMTKAVVAQRPRAIQPST